MIFRRYLELGSVRALKAALDEEGVVSKLRRAADGSPYGGNSFSLQTADIARRLTNTR